SCDRKVAAGHRAKFVPADQRTAAGSAGNRGICSAAEGIEGSRGADIDGAGVFGASAAAPASLRTFAAQESFANCAEGSRGRGVEGGGFLGPEEGTHAKAAKRAKKLLTRSSLRSHRKTPYVVSYIECRAAKKIEHENEDEEDSTKASTKASTK